MSWVTVLYGGKPLKASEEVLKKLAWQHAYCKCMIHAAGGKVFGFYGANPMLNVRRRLVPFELSGRAMTRDVKDRCELIGRNVKPRSITFRRVGARLLTEHENAREFRVKLYKPRRVAEVVDRRIKRDPISPAVRFNLGLRLLASLRNSSSLSIDTLCNLVREDIDTVTLALLKLEEEKFVRSTRNAFSCTKRGLEVLREIETMSGIDLRSQFVIGEQSYRDVVWGGSRVKGVDVMKAQATALARDVAAEPPTEEVDHKLMNDPNYRAYLKELAALEAAGEECYVAYANGKRVAKEKTYRNLLDKIGERYDNVLIQEVPHKEIGLHQPFHVET